MKKCNSFLSNSCILLLFVFVLSVFITCLTAPWIKLLLKQGFKISLSLSQVMSRSFMAYVLLLFLLYRKKLKSNVGESLNHTRLPWVRHLLMGSAIGVGSLMLMAAIMLIVGAAEIEGQFSLIQSCRKLLKYLGTAVAVALVEEILFRGIILQSLRANLKAFLALILTSAIFSLLHFLKPVNPPDISQFGVLNGFVVLPSFFQQFSDFQSIMWITLGLFLIGLALGTAYLVTSSLFLPIGIHAGWVFFNKADSLFLEIGKRKGLLFGQTDKSMFFFLDSIAAWIMIGVMIILLLAFGKKIGRQHAE